MRLPMGRPILVGVAAAGLVFSLSCNDSKDMVTSPGVTSPAANVAGTWSGSFQPDVSTRCTGSTAQAQLTQNGHMFSGPFQASSCGISGTFKGTVQGNMLSGTVNMIGCTGGAVSGTVTASGLSFSIGDFHKTLLPGGPQDVMSGGAVSLSR